MKEKISIKIENFEGPLDLLFHLIEKNKIDIYDIPIATITEQYLEYLRAMNDLDLEIASEFLVMAATLLHIKSRMLLPKQKIDDEEYIDPRVELVQRLIEYKRFKEFADDLKEREKIQRMVYYKLPEPIQFDYSNNRQLVGLNIEDLITAFGRILERNEKTNKNKPIDLSKIVHREQVSVAKKLREIVRLLRKNDSIRFTTLFSEKSGRAEKIAVFLAVLELIKIRRITVEQTDSFGEIMISASKHIHTEDINIDTNEEW